MEDSAFSEEFCGFIHTAIPSVAAAELLLLIFRHPGRWWTALELRGALPSDVNITEAETAACLDALRSRGLVEFDDKKRTRYCAASDALDTQVRTLAQAYNERPVTLIRMIYALRDSKIQSFADAFKIRKR
jgi:predicted deacylase